MNVPRELLDQAADLVESLAGAPFDRLAARDTAAFLDSIRLVGTLARTVDTLGSLLSAELTRRVQTDAAFRREALGGEVGGRFADELMRELLQLDESTIRDWDRVGAAIAPRVSLQGEVLPCAHEQVASAVLDGTLTARAAAIIARGIDGVRDNAELHTLEGVEATLVACAPALTTRELTRVVRTLPDRFDPDGAEPREERLRARSSLSIRDLPNGLTRLVAELHPEAAGFVRAALDAHTAPRRQVSFSAEPAEPAEAGEACGGGADAGITPTPETAIEPDTRPLTQKRVDALVAVCRESLANDAGSLAGTSVTMLVTVALETLESGVGTAAIAAVGEPISASTARRLCAQADIIPVVLGSASEPLDLGRVERLYTEPQRRALAARDGGCIWPGCTMPPAWCEVAHVVAWALGGTTDLANGALMCPHHHRRFDNDGWGLRREDGVAYLIPPTWLDPQQTPRRAGRFTLAA